MRFERRLRRAGLVLGVSLALVGCGSGAGEGDASAAAADSAAAATDTTTAPSSEPTESAAGDDNDNEPTVPPEVAAGDEPSPICDTIPSLEAISAIVGEPVYSVADNSDPTILLPGAEQMSVSQRCDVSGDGFGNAIFERWDLELGNGVIEVAEADGQIVDYTAAELPGAIAWANGILLERDGLYWYVTAITAETVGVMDAPGAYDDSAELMRAWVSQ